jgi:hypothetical protein
MKMDRTVVRKLSMDDPDFEEKNMMIFEGTPDECWEAIRDVNKLAWNLSYRKNVVDVPMRRDVARKYSSWDEVKDPIDYERIVII